MKAARDSFNRRQILSAGVVNRASRMVRNCRHCGDSLQARVAIFCEKCSREFKAARNADRFLNRLRAFVSATRYKSPDSTGLVWLGRWGFEARRRTGSFSIYAGRSGSIFKAVYGGE